jgi:hypothetical protein
VGGTASQKANGKRQMAKGKRQKLSRSAHGMSLVNASALPFVF